LWRHKSRHAALVELERKYKSNAGEAAAFTATTNHNNSSASSNLDSVPEASTRDVKINGEIPKAEPASPPSVIEGNLDQNYNIPLAAEKLKSTDHEVSGQQSGVDVDHAMVPDQCKPDVVAKVNKKAASLLQQIPLGVLPPGVAEHVGRHGNVRLIGRYGYVITTEEGKLYNCIDCSKSFRNRVSLWKHQSKHQ
jgi:hypothetical protein